MAKRKKTGKGIGSLDTAKTKKGRALQRRAVFSKMEEEGKLYPKNKSGKRTIKRKAQAASEVNKKEFVVLYVPKHNLKKKGKLRGQSKTWIVASDRSDAIAQVEKYEDFGELISAKPSGRLPLEGVDPATQSAIRIIEKYIAWHQSEITVQDLIDMMNEIDAADFKPTANFYKEIMRIRGQVQSGAIKMRQVKEPFKINITGVEKYKRLISPEGLGFLPFLFSAVGGKLAEKGIERFMSKKKDPEVVVLNGVDLSRFVRADQEPPQKPADIFRLPGELGKFLQDIQANKYAIHISGDPHAGKTEFVTQLIDAFASIGKRVGFYSLEQGGKGNKDTDAALDRNLKVENEKNVFTTGEAQKGLQTIKEECAAFDVIVIDSWQKLKLPATEFDTLRQDHPDKIWIVIFQQNAEGKSRGGSASDYDAPVRLKVHLVDKSHRNNWVELLKNRGNSLNVKYMWFDKKTVPYDLPAAEPKKTKSVSKAPETGKKKGSTVTKTL